MSRLPAAPPPVVVMVTARSRPNRGHDLRLIPANAADALPAGPLRDGVRAVLAQAAERDANGDDFTRLLAARQDVHDADDATESAAVLAGDDFTPQLYEHDRALELAARRDEAMVDRIDALMAELDDLLAEHRVDTALAVGRTAAKSRHAAVRRLTEAADALEQAAELADVAVWLGSRDPNDAERVRVLRTLLAELNAG